MTKDELREYIKTADEEQKLKLHNYSEKYGISEDEVIERLSEAIDFISEMLLGAIKLCIRAFDGFLCSTSKNRRVAYLAKHSKKKRTRKKNMQRLKKEAIKCTKEALNENKKTLY